MKRVGIRLTTMKEKEKELVFFPGQRKKRRKKKEEKATRRKAQVGPQDPHSRFQALTLYQVPM